MQTLEDKVVAKIYGKGRGCVFTPSDFASLGDPRSVVVALSRLYRKNTIRRLARGLYDYPKQHPELGTLSPSPDAIAKALAGRDATRLAGLGRPHKHRGEAASFPEVQDLIWHRVQF